MFKCIHHTFCISGWKVTVQKLLFPCKRIRQKFPSCICPLMRTSIRCRISTLRSGICINSSADMTHLSTFSTFVKHRLECSWYDWQPYTNHWGRTRVCNEFEKHGNISIFITAPTLCSKAPVDTDVDFDSHAPGVISFQWQQVISKWVYFVHWESCSWCDALCTSAVDTNYTESYITDTVYLGWQYIDLDNVAAELWLSST